MKFLKRWWKKRKTFKAYRGQLRKYLREKYGRSRNLRHQEVKDSLSELGLNGEFELYAYAMSLSKSQYKYYQKLSGVIYSQRALQIELGVSEELLNTQNFPNNNYGP